MLDQDSSGTKNGDGDGSDESSGTATPAAASTSSGPPAAAPPKGRRAASRPAGPPAAPTFAAPAAEAPASDAAASDAAASDPAAPDPVADPPPSAAPGEEAPAPARRTRRSTKKVATSRDAAVPDVPAVEQDNADLSEQAGTSGQAEPAGAGPTPEQKPTSPRRTRRSTRKTAAPAESEAPAGAAGGTSGQADLPADPQSDPPSATLDDDAADAGAGSDDLAGPEEPASLFSASAPPTRRRRTRKTAADVADQGAERAEQSDAPDGTGGAGAAGVSAAGSVPLFKAPDPEAVPARRSTRQEAPSERADQDSTTTENEPGQSSAPDQASQDDDADDESGARRRRRRGGRRRRKSGAGDAEASQSTAETGASGDRSAAEESAATSTDTPSDQQQAEVEPSEKSDEKQTGAGESAGGDGESTSSSTRRRRRRRRKGEPEAPSDDDPENTVVRVRDRRPASDGITSVEGSTRLEAKKQRRREGRDAGRKRVPILSESEFLARRESVTREMVVRQRGEVTQIAVLEDNVLVEHYVARESQTSLMGNVYLGRVQNVLPSMEAAFVDIGKGRNAVLYAGEVDWKALGFEGKPRKIEDALSSGQSVLVQVSKDPVDHKGARLTGQVSLPGRFLVYVPRGHSNGISRKLPESERSRLKGLLKDILPEDAGVIVRTAAEGATEEQLSRDVSGLTARWEDIEKKSKTGQGPKLLYGEPDLLLKVVRDLFNEDFAALTVQGDDAWDNIEAYVKHVAPDLGERLKRYEGDDVFSNYRVDEQIAKALDRKVFLPSGGSLVIDRTEAMTVVDVNTGKFTGSGGNLEETVTRNNLEAAEEVVRQLRLRDIGGIIVVDFIDMVLELNRDLVLRRLVECLSRDRTRHQVAEVTSLGLVQMTRKKIGTGLLEAFGQTCEQCGGRGVLMHTDPIDPAKSSDDGGRKGSRRRGGGGKAQAAKSEATPDDKGSGDPDTAPVPEPVGEPVAESVGEPAAESVGEPVADPVDEPVTGSVSDADHPKDQPKEQPVDESVDQPQQV